jgi:uncharacterized coiled-coil protein SlyX
VATQKATIETLSAKIIQLETTVATQKATIETLSAAKAEADADEKLVLAKMGLGLSRPQAAAVVKRQKAYDASPLAAKHVKFNEQAAARKAKAEKAE